MRTPFRPVPRNIGEASPLAIALSSIGAGLQGYGKNQREREEVDRLNSAEMYRRKLQQQALEREERIRTEDIATKNKREAQDIQTLMGVAPKRLGRALNEGEARGIVRGYLNPSDLFDPPPTGAATLANRADRVRADIDEGNAILALMGQNSSKYTPEERQRFWTSFNRAVAGRNLSGDDLAIAAKNAFAGFEQETRGARQEAVAGRRLRPRAGLPTDSADARPRLGNTSIPLNNALPSSGMTQDQLINDVLSRVKFGPDSTARR